MPNALGIDTVSTVRYTVLTLWSGCLLNRVHTMVALYLILWLASVLTIQVTAGVNRDNELLDQGTVHGYGGRSPWYSTISGVLLD